MRHNLFNWCCHCAYGDAAMWLKCVRHLKNAIFTQNFAMRATPGNSFKVGVSAKYKCRYISFLEYRIWSSLRVGVSMRSASAGMFQSWSVGFGAVSEWECHCEVQVQVYLSSGVWDLE